MKSIRVSLKIILDFARRKISYVPACKLYLQGKTTIPAHSEAICFAKIGSKHAHLINGLQGDTESLDSIRSRGVFQIRSAAIVNDGKVPLRFYNPTNSDITINRRELVGSFKAWTPDNLVSAPINAPNTPTVASAKVHVPVDLSQCNISESHKQQLHEIIDEYHDLFPTGSHDIGLTHLIEHEIELFPNTRSIKQQPYKNSPYVLEKIEEEIQKLLQKGIIERCPKTAFSSPVIAVRKKDNTIRIVNDFRQLNKASVPQTYRSPTVAESRLEIGRSSAQLFTVLDLSKGSGKYPSPKKVDH